MLRDAGLRLINTATARMKRNPISAALTNWRLFGRAGLYLGSRRFRAAKITVPHAIPNQAPRVPLHTIAVIESAVASIASRRAGPRDAIARDAASGAVYNRKFPR